MPKEVSSADRLRWAVVFFQFHLYMYVQFLKRNA